MSRGATPGDLAARGGVHDDEKSVDLLGLERLRHIGDRQILEMNLQALQIVFPCERLDEFLIRLSTNDADGLALEIIHTRHANQITAWKAQLESGAAEVFGPGGQAVVPAIDVKSLHAKIGELTLENDFLEGALTKAGLLSAKR